MENPFKILLIFSILKYCSNTLTTDVTHLIDEWTVGQCCHFAQTDNCRHSCLNFQTIHHLDGCNEQLKSCLKNQLTNIHQSAHNCCSDYTLTKQCLKSCNNLYESYDRSSSKTVNKRLKNRFRKHCKQFKEVNDCMETYIKGIADDEQAKNTELKIMCCNKTSDLMCSQSCNQLLKTRIESKQMIDALVSICGLPFSGEQPKNDNLWHCFLSFSEPVNDKNKLKTEIKVKNLNINGNIKRFKNRKKSTDLKKPTDSELKASKRKSTVIRSQNRFGMDSAKLFCCFRAKSDTCRILCQRTWSDQWLENWHQFDSICQYSPQETELTQCLDDVDGLCQSGCQSLDFCEEFNDRPNQLYRKCDSRADMEAKADFESWMKGVIHYNVIDIPVKNIAECYPEFWKLIACSIHLKPCLEENHYNNICRSSCVDIISECIDSNRIPSSVVSAQTICDIIATNSSDNCIDIKIFLNKKQSTEEDVLTSEPTDSLISACNPSPCSPNQICLANNKCLFGQCLPFRCVSACRLGEMSPFLVETGSVVKLLDLKDNCYQLCKCGIKGQLIDCNKICDKNYRKDCSHDGHNIRHLTKLSQNNKQFVCFDSNIHSINTDCIDDCPQDYSPVCATSGQTFPNQCYAECNHFSAEQYIRGSCHSMDYCIKCSENQRCVKKSQICLTSSGCPQYECISVKIDCHLFGTNPICDTKGMTHKNLCWLLRKGQSFAYYGKCLIYCSQSGPVCAINGITYQSECEAHSHSVLVDYYSECIHTNTCDQIKCVEQPKCPDLLFAHKLSHTCCPVCGSVAQLIYDKNFIESIDNKLKTKYSVTVEDLAKSLTKLIKVFGCQTHTYLSIDGSVIVLVRPTDITPTVRQLEDCDRELRRVVTLINNQSPIVSLKYPLSLLISGTVLKTRNVPNIGSKKSKKLNEFLIISMLWSIYYA